MHLSNNQAGNETSERIQLVHPYTPEPGHLAGDDRDTTEEREDDEQEGVDGGCNLDAGCQRRNSLTTACAVRMKKVVSTKVKVMKYNVQRTV